MRKRIPNRLGAERLRDAMRQFIDGAMSVRQVMELLQIGETRLCELKRSCSEAMNEGRGDEWTPGLSGGRHYPSCPMEVCGFLRSVLATGSNADRFSYAFAAAEAGRRFGVMPDRSQIRKWAIAQGVKDFRRKPHVSPHTRRWQRKAIGEPWRLDAAPDCFPGRENPQLHLIGMLDDCSRVQVGCGLHAKECLEAYLHLFHGAFSRFGLPLQVYVDKACFFNSTVPGNVTAPEERLNFYGVSFILANPPEANGRIERARQVWQDRLPKSFRHEGFDAATPLETLNDHIGDLVDYRNVFETHGGIGMTPQDAWDKAVAEGRNKLRVPPNDGWWELVWAKRRANIIAQKNHCLIAGNRVSFTASKVSIGKRP